MLTDAERVHHGQRLSEKLLKQLEGEDPMIALLGLGVAFAEVAYRRCKIHRNHAVKLMETLYNALMNPTVQTAQEAASRLIIPGRL